MYEPNIILGRDLMKKFGVSEYDLFQIMKKGLQPLDGSFNTKVEVARLLISEDTPDDLSLLHRLEFSIDDVRKFCGNRIILNGREVYTDSPEYQQFEERNRELSEKHPPLKPLLISDRELTNTDEWMTYEELKERWGNRPNKEFLRLMHKIGLTAFKWAPSTPGTRHIEPPFRSYEPESADDLKNCFFIRFHVDQKERDYPERIGEKQEHELEESTPKPPSCRPGTRWEDITFITYDLVEDPRIRVNTPEWKKTFTYHELGMADKRHGDKPKHIWMFLMKLAYHTGRYAPIDEATLGKTSQRGFDKHLVKRASELNAHMKRIFRINDSFYAHHYNKHKAYITKSTFKTSPLPPCPDYENS